MPATVIITLKNSPKVNLLIRDSDNLLTSRGFRIFSQNPRIYYNNEQVNSTSLDSVVKMIKQSEFFNQSVKSLIYTAQFKK
jgi:hypothetical protein